MFYKTDKELVHDPDEYMDHMGYDDHLPIGFFIEKEWVKLVLDKARVRQLQRRYNEYAFRVKEDDD